MSKILNNFRQRFMIANKSSKIMFIIGTSLLILISSLYIYNLIFGYSPYKTTGDLFSPPSPQHIMGTDQLGRDIFSRVTYGTRYSLTIAFISIIISFTIGAPIGAISGYFAGKVDRIFSIVFDALSAFPGIIFAILIAVMIGPGMITTSIAISIRHIAPYFRMVRGTSLSIKERPFIEALIALGARPRNLIFKHILVYTIPSLLTITMLNIGRAILSVSGLGFLGLGLPPPAPELGTDLGRGRAFITMGAWWTSTFPGLMIVITVLAFTLIGESLNDIYSTKFA